MSKVKDFYITRSRIINDVILFNPSINFDERGTLYTSFHNDVFKDFLPEGLSFIHDKFSKSNKNVLRGIHGDSKSWKIVTAAYGEIYQVVVDYRPSSPSFKKWDAFRISDKNPISVLLPPGIGNAFFVESNYAVYHYKLAYIGTYFDADEQFTLKWNDPDIGVKWPVKDPILSNRDK